MQTETVNLLRPHEVQEAQAEKASIEEMLFKSPPEVRGQIDIGQARQHLRAVTRKLDECTPRPAQGAELDGLVKREAELRAKILEGMPTQAEMRRNPPGAVTKHQAWERGNKRRIREWKNIRLRLHVSGEVDSGIDSPTEVANLERYRPHGGSGEMNLDAAGTQIPGKVFHLPPIGAGLGSVFTEEELEKMSPEVKAILCLMDNTQRAELKAALAKRGPGRPPKSEVA